MKGLEELDALGDDIADLFEEMLDEAAEDGAAVAREHAPGSIASAIVVKRTSRFRRQIIADKYYARFVEEGHPQIVAKKKVLHFVVNGQDTFVRRVKPTQPRPFMGPAVEALLSRGAA